MTEKERRLLKAALDSGHITIQCPGDHDGRGPCDDSDLAWKALWKFASARAPKQKQRSTK